MVDVAALGRIVVKPRCVLVLPASVGRGGYLPNYTQTRGKDIAEQAKLSALVRSLESLYPDKGLVRDLRRNLHFTQLGSTSGLTGNELIERKAVEAARVSCLSLRIWERSERNDARMRKALAAVSIQTAFRRHCAQSKS